MNLTGFDPEKFPRTAEHDNQRANTRHGIDRLIENWITEGRLLYALSEKPNVIITTGEEVNWGFDYYISNKAPSDLRYAGPIRVKNTLKKEWGVRRFNARIDKKLVYGLEFPSLAELRKMFVAKHGKIDVDETVTQWGSDIDELPF